MVDAQFADALSYRLYIPGIPKGQAVKAGRDHCAYPLVLEPYSPLSEGLGLFEFNHREYCSLQTTTLSSLGLPFSHANPWIICLRRPSAHAKFLCRFASTSSDLHLHEHDLAAVKC
jgi:hypothetical protein